MTQVELYQLFECDNNCIDCPCKDSCKNQLEKESLLLSSYKEEMEDEIVDEWKRYMGDF